MEMKEGKWIGVSMLALALAAPCGAGEFQLGMRVGMTNLSIDGARMRDGQRVRSDGLGFGITAGYRMPLGLVVEAGIMGSTDISEDLLSGTVHKSLAVGWPYEIDQWRITPKAGFTHTYLDGSDGRNFLEDGAPSERFTDTVPFIEANVERRVGRRFAVGAFVRHVFEDFGDSQSIGFSWALYFD
jgi:hypothetical protein